MKYMLILIFVTSNGVAISPPIEFETRQACSTALAYVKAKESGPDGNGGYGYCFAKGQPNG